MAITTAMINVLLDVFIFVLAAIIVIQVARAASRFHTGETGVLFSRLRAGFIVFFLFALFLGVGSTLAYLEISPNFMATGQSFEVMILLAHVLLIMALVILMAFAKKFAEFSERFGFK